MSDPQDLPCPRLELLWRELPPEEKGGLYEWECLYSIVIPLREFDIRRGEDNERSETVAQLGRTRAGGPPIHDGWISIPFRDGAHAKWDCLALGGHLPIVARLGDQWRIVENNLKAGSEAT